MPSPTLLTKTKFCIGLQCHLRLWWTVGEPDAPELVPDAITRYRFATGHEVGEEARRRFPGGTLIDYPPGEKAAAVAATARAVRAGAGAIFEAAFEGDGVHVRVDVLLRGRRGAWRLLEVKSTTKVKDAHIPDMAVQLATLRCAGLDIEAVELMHLNRRCRHPDLSNLFERSDCTGRAKDFLPRVSPLLREMEHSLAMASPPEVPLGDHCFSPHHCPFLGRCWSLPSEHHFGELYGLSAGQRSRLEAAGVRLVGEIPDGFPLSEIQARQRQAVRTGKPVVTALLARRLAEPVHPLFYLDFETFAPAIPRYPGTRPYDQVPVQFSLHTLRRDLRLEHREHLDESDDPRPVLAGRLTEALGQKGTIVTYSPFEKRVVGELAEALPSRRRELLALLPRFWDLHRVIQSGIYHPDFRGSFSIKDVFPALCRGEGYGRSAINSGQEAAVLYGELIGSDTPPERKAEIRSALREYCALDTRAMVDVHRALLDFSPQDFLTGQR